MNQKRQYAGYQTTKRMKHEDDEQVELGEQEVLIMEQQKQFTSDYLYSTFKQLVDAIQENKAQRQKYSQQPERFYDSQAVLNQTVSGLSSISAYAQLVPDFIKSNLMKLLIELLDHPNEIVVGQVVQVISQFLLMEIEAQQIAEQHLRFWKAVANQNFLTKLLNLLDRLNQQQSEQYQTVHRVLRITEQLLTINPGISNLIVDCSKIMKYLSDRILPNFIIEYKKIDDNKFVSSQILVQLLQFSPENRFTFNKYNGMQVLLECIIPYKDQQLPKDLELEFLVNIFDLVCIMNIQKDVQIIFNEQEGVSLMLSFIKLKNYLSKHSLKCLASGMIKQSIKPFIQNGGLKYVFPILLHHGVKQKQLDQQMIIDENTTQIILELLKLAEGMDLDRVIYKFKQKNFQKLLRLVEMRVEYSDIIQQLSTQVLPQDQYLIKLGQGLHIIQIIDLVLLHLLIKNRQLKSNIKQMFKYLKFDTSKIQISLKQHLRYLSPTSQQHQFIKNQIHNMFPYLTSNQ